MSVSIHAPVWGATLGLHDIHQKRGFNPRTRVGCDNPDHLFLGTRQVSIHAPVWGAT